MKPRIKLMADYYCYPLWGMDEDNIGDIDPKTLPLSENLINQLEVWSKIYDLTLNKEDPKYLFISYQIRFIYPSYNLG